MDKPMQIHLGAALAYPVYLLGVHVVELIVAIHQKNPYELAIEHCRYDTILLDPQLANVVLVEIHLVDLFLHDDVLAQHVHDASTLELEA